MFVGRVMKVRLGRSYGHIFFLIVGPSRLYPYERVQHRFGGMRDMRNIEGGMRDENILGGMEMRSFQLVGCGIVLKLIAGCGI